MSELREAAQAALNQWDKVSGVFRMTAETEALRAVLAQPETEAEPVVEPVAWESRWIDPEEGPSDWVPTRNPDFYRSRRNHEVRPLYAHPPRDEWRLASEPPEDGRDVVVWMNDGGHGCFAIGHCLRGEWSPNYLGSPVTHWRDVSPPAENQR